MSRVTPTTTQTPTEIINELISLGRDTKRKRINTLKKDIAELEYIVKDFSKRLQHQISIWYLGEIYLNYDLKLLNSELAAYKIALIMEQDNLI